VSFERDRSWSWTAVKWNTRPTTAIPTKSNTRPTPPPVTVLHSLSFSQHNSCIVSPRHRHFHIIPHTSLHLTACQQFFHDHSLRHFFIVFRCLHTACSLDLFFSPFFFSPVTSSNFTVCTLNIRSILHHVHSAALSDLVDLHKPDLLCLSETLITPTTTSTELINCTALHLATPSSALLVTSLRTLLLPAVVLISLSVNLSLSYHFPFQPSLPVNHLFLPSSFLTQIFLF